MRVFVKDMSGNFLHATTPRKARILLKEKKAVIESNDPFTIRLLFPASECGMKDSKPSNKNKSGLLLPEKDNTMCNNELLYKEMHEDFYDFIQRSVDQILSNPNHMKATWCRDINPACDGGIPESFAYFLFCDASVKIAKQNGMLPGNFMITGKQGFDILKSLGEPRFKLDEEHKFGVLDGMMKVYYIKSMNENKFIMSIHEDREEYEDRGIYEKHYEGYKETNQFVVGEIVDKDDHKESSNEDSVIGSKNVIIYEKDNNMYEIKNQPSIISTVSNRGTFKDHIQHFDSRDVDEFVKYYGCVPTKLCAVGTTYDPNKHTVITELPDYSSELPFLKYASMAEDKIDKDDIRLDKQIYDVYLLQILKRDDRCHVYKYIVYSRLLDMFITCKSYIVVQPSGSNCVKCAKNDISRFVIRNLLFDFVGDEGSKKWNALKCTINLFDFAPKHILWKLDAQISEMKEMNPSFEYDIDKYNDTEYVLEYSAYSLYNKKKDEEIDCSVSETKEVIADKSVSDDQNNDCNQINPNHNIVKTHLIYGRCGCGKTTYLAQLIKEKINQNIDVCLITNVMSYKHEWFRDKHKYLHIFEPKELSIVDGNPEDVAKQIVQYYISRVGRCNVNTLAIDEVPFHLLFGNGEYSEEEYFRELSKMCKGNNINFVTTKSISGYKIYWELPRIYEKFSDIITVIK